MHIAIWRLIFTVLRQSVRQAALALCSAGPQPQAALCYIAAFFPSGCCWPISFTPVLRVLCVQALGWKEMEQRVEPLLERYGVQVSRARRAPGRCVSLLDVRWQAGCCPLHSNGLMVGRLGLHRLVLLQPLKARTHTVWPCCFPDPYCAVLCVLLQAYFW